ncbi:hypothetical protein BLGI_155 [Brevibacillus laterosporus GI-9]|nr:hypothetical protein BLGI_155 [Brevibacillus laterosporus GI-9]
MNEKYEYSQHENALKRHTIFIYKKTRPIKRRVFSIILYQVS